CCCTGTRLPHRFFYRWRRSSLWASHPRSPRTPSSRRRSSFACSSPPESSTPPPPAPPRVATIPPQILRRAHPLRPAAAMAIFQEAMRIHLPQQQRRRGPRGRM
ncbi:unnamed protein product, partial [Ectocarpus sp. 12 AP-2014]